MPPLLRLDRHEPSIVLLTLDRPDRKNALSIALRDEISDAMDDLANDQDLKVVVMTGAGTAFCAGFDLSEFDRAFAEPDYAERLWASSDRYHRSVLHFPLPTVAAVNGPALGGGFDLAIMLRPPRGRRPRRGSPIPSTPSATWCTGPCAMIWSEVRSPASCASPAATSTPKRRSGSTSSRRSSTPDTLVAEAIDVARTISAAPRENLVRTKAKALRHAGLGADEATLDL